MSYVIVDVESDGPIPAEYSMVCFGAVVFDELLDHTFYGRTRPVSEARVKAGREAALLKAVADGSLGRGSVAGDEYIYDLQHARVGADGVAHWVETCFCATPLAEERPY